MRTTVSIDDDLLRQAKRVAIDSDRSLSDVVSEALRELLVRRKETTATRVRLITSGHNSRVVPGLDFSDNAAVRAALDDEWDRRQLTAGDAPEDD
ncbi:MAG: type II toxin-antitoxin system VapB family antitoxin [Dehalococcoidia bacterium]